MENTEVSSTTVSTVSKWQAPSLMMRRSREESCPTIPLPHCSKGSQAASSLNSVGPPSSSPNGLCNEDSSDRNRLRGLIVQDVQVSSPMDAAMCTRVQLNFRGEVKLLRLSPGDNSLSSMRNLKNLAKRCFPEIRGLLETGAWKKIDARPRLAVKCTDGDAGYVAVNSDIELMDAFVKGKSSFENDESVKPLMFIIDVKTPGISSNGHDIDASVISLTEERIPMNFDHRRKCRYFQSVGGCMHGSKCLYSHESPKSLQLHDHSSLPAAEIAIKGQCQREGSEEGGVPHRERSAPLLHDQQDSTLSTGRMNECLLSEIRLNAAENIQHLGSGEGWRLLSKVVDQKDLSSETINLLLTLVVKDDIRSSPLRRETNEIYGVFLGSRFLSQLQVHIFSHLVNTSHSADLEDVVRRSLLLIEELQGRTCDGWKEVPLDAIHSVVLRLDIDESSGRDELLTTVQRLLDQRNEILVMNQSVDYLHGLT